MYFKRIALVTLLAWAVFFLVMLFACKAYAGDKIHILIHNDTDHKVVAYIDQIDHDVRINGQLWPFPVPVCGAELQPDEDFFLTPRERAKAPHRYLIRWNDYKGNSWDVVNRREFVVKFAPPDDHFVINSQTVHRFTAMDDIAMMSYAPDQLQDFKIVKRFGYVGGFIGIGVISDDGQPVMVLLFPNRVVASWAYEEDGEIIVMGWNPQKEDYEKQPVTNNAEKSIRILLKQIEASV